MPPTISGTAGERNICPRSRHFKSRANAQDGHEAIRPASIAITPDQVKDSLTGDQYKLYKLIWERFIACQMANCVLNTTQATITAGRYLFKASGFNVAFEGFTALYEESKDEEEKAGKDLPALQEGMKLKVKDLKGNQHFTQPPPRSYGSFPDQDPGGKWHWPSFHLRGHHFPPSQAENMWCGTARPLSPRSLER